jgi:Arc/MetJ-type ribon-helix-helix transcriptional regulator
MSAAGSGRSKRDCNSMPMQTLQIRLTDGQLKSIDRLVKRQVYPNRCEAVRDAVRRLFEQPETTGNKKRK